MPDNRTGIVIPIAEKRGGAEQSLLDFLSGVAPTSQDAYRLLFLVDGPMVEMARTLGFASDVVNAGRLRNPGRMLLTQWAIAKWIRRHRIDVVVSWMSKAHLYASIPAKVLGAKPAWFQHDVYAGSRMDRLNATLPTSLVLCCSEGSAAAMRTRFPKLPVVSTRLAVDAVRFNAEACQSQRQARLELGLVPDVPFVLLVARLERWKGVHVFLEAASSLLDAGQEVQFAVVGGRHPLDPGYEQELQDAIARSGHSRRMQLAGHQKNVPQWMCAADIVTHTSVKPEPFGIVVLEAMAMGKPVIATAHGGPTEVITHNHDGLLIQPDDASVLADTIRGVLDDGEGRTKLGAVAVTTASAYTPERFAVDVETAIETVRG